ncbi:hypothetical protein [Nonomuraea fuscirosea]|uniref:restriction system modified-DNA reader domain-containing protein n=1 Tax=Nonomuraea fuscirosea TaxID=1291556 RepID=UPI0033F068E2
MDDAVATVEQTCYAILIALQESPEGALSAKGFAPRISEELTGEDPEVAVERGEAVEPAPGDWELETKPHYGVNVRDLIEANLMEPGAEIKASRRHERFSATVQSDGRIRLPSGQICTSPSTAGQVVLGRQSCNGWTFWRVKVREEWVLLEVLRNEYLTSRKQ